jgi:hypothetical protein
MGKLLEESCILEGKDVQMYWTISWRPCFKASSGWDYSPLQEHSSMMVWHLNCCYRLLSYLLASQCIFDPSFLYNTWTKCPLLQNRISHNKSDFIADKCGIDAGYYFILILFKIDVYWTDLFGLNASRRWHALFSLLAFVQLAVNHFMATRMLI